MSGIEAVGLVLGVFPVCVKLVNAYREKVRDEEVHQLDRSLNNRATIFLNATIELLAAVVSKRELSAMLEDPNAELWHNEAFNMKLRTQLGNRDATQLFSTASKISETIQKLQHHLPQTLIGDGQSRTFWRRAKHVMHVFKEGPATRASLQRLVELTDEYRVIVDQGLRLVPYRAAPYNRIARLKEFRDHALALYEAIRGSCECSCGDTHIARLQLEPGTDGLSIAADGELHRFKLLFSPKLSSGESPISDDWTWTEVAPSPSRPRAPSYDRGICRMMTDMKLDTDPDTCLGNPTSQKRQFRVRRADSKASERDMPFRSMSLSELHRSSTKPAKDHGSRQPQRRASIIDFNGRVSLARTLGWSVLQLQNTHWLETHWEAENIYLIPRESNSPLTYVTHEFRSGAARGSTLPRTGKPRMTIWAPNEELLTLGIILIELCCEQSIEDLSIPEDKGNAFLTAMRVSKTLDSRFGLKYKEAIRACLGYTVDRDIPEADLKDEAFQLWVLDNIVMLLDDSAKWFVRDRGQSATSDGSSNSGSRDNSD